MHFRISSSLSFQRKTKRHVFLLLFVLTHVYLNWPSYLTGKCYRSQRKLISSMKHWWLYLTIHSLTIFKWKMRNLRLYLSFFVQYIWKYNVRERALILFLSSSLHFLTWYHISIKWWYNDSGRCISESLVLWYRGLRFLTKISKQIGKSVWFSAIHLNCT